MTDDRDNDAIDGATPTPGSIDAAEVGYGHPPKHHRFQPGKSGNPRAVGQRALRVGGA